MEKVGIVLAAGKGTRMNSLYNQTAKVCFKIFDKCMIEYVVDALNSVDVKNLITIVGYKAEEVVTLLNNRSDYVYQQEQKGTGHAIMQVLPSLKENQTAIIVCGDTPLLTKDTLKALIDYHNQTNSDATILEADVDNPYGYGRLVKENGNLVKIVEEKDASVDIKKINTINTGVYVISTNSLLKYIPMLKPVNAQNEYYLTDIFQLLISDNQKVSCFKTMNSSEFLGVNDRVQLAQATKVIQKQINEKHMLKGVTIVDPDTTYIGMDVLIGNDTIIYPNTHLYGKTIIGTNCQIGPNVYVNNTLLQDCVIIKNKVVENSQLDVTKKN